MSAARTTCLSVIMASLLDLLSLAPFCLADGTSFNVDLVSYDCGTIALHTLLALEGRATDIESLSARLPAKGPQGHSMAELIDAARACGLQLTGVRLPRSDRSPDRSALVFLKWRDHGHFLVIRPVGHTGKLIQIIDSAGDPIIMDASDLYASDPWTGLALIPNRPDWPSRVAVGLLVLCTSTFLLLLAVGRFRAAREGASSPAAAVRSSQECEAG